MRNEIQPQKDKHASCLNNLIFITGLSLATFGATSEVVREITIQSQLTAQFPDLISYAEYQKAHKQAQTYQKIIQEARRAKFNTAAAEIEALPNYKDSVSIIGRYTTQQQQRTIIARETSGLTTELTALGTLFAGGIMLAGSVLTPWIIWLNKLELFSTKDNQNDDNSNKPN